MSAATWRKRDDRVKIHYSDQWPGEPSGTHSKIISVQRFHEFHEGVRDLDVDIMLEVKDKERSILRLMQSLPDLRAVGAVRRQPISSPASAGIGQQFEKPTEAGYALRAESRNDLIRYC
jgi:UV DNA damage repair endonuclease